MPRSQQQVQQHPPPADASSAMAEDVPNGNEAMEEDVEQEGYGEHRCL